MRAWLFCYCSQISLSVHLRRQRVKLPNFHLLEEIRGGEILTSAKGGMFGDDGAGFELMTLDIGTSVSSYSTCLL